MNDFETEIILTALISLAITIYILVKLYSISKNTKNIISEYDEYYISMRMGDKEMAYKHLMRSFLQLRVDRSEEWDYETTKKYYEMFLKLGIGIPDLYEFEKFKN
jgi:sRNA-binding regulator protein Hfq